MTVTQFFSAIRGVLLISLGCCLSACAPTATSASRPEPYLGSERSGPIESIAVLLGEDLLTSYSVDFDNQLYGRTLLELQRHPYYRSRFDLLERRQLEDLLAEQDLADSIYADSVTAPRLGELLGVGYIAIVELLQATAEKVSVGSSGIPHVGSISASGYDVQLDLTLRLVDVETGRIVGTGLGEERSFVGSRLIVQGQSFGQDPRESALLDRVPDAIYRAANDLAIQVDTR